MKKNFLLLLSVPFCIHSMLAQSDTIYTNSKKIIASVEEINPKTVKFHYPNESLSNSIYKNKIRKIIFQNGRVQEFKSSSFADIKSIDDYDKVVVTKKESDIEGLKQVGQILAEAKGRTVFTSSKKMKNRAYKNLKLQAAMLGSNVVLLGDSDSESGRAGSIFSSARAAKAELTGFAYSTNYLDLNKFKSKIKGKGSFPIASKYKLKSTKTNIKKYSSNSDFVISEVAAERGNIYIYGTIDKKGKAKRYQLSRFNKESFGIYISKKKKEYYYKVNFQ